MENQLKILVINPNISLSVTELIRNEAQRAALPNTQITMATASFGVAYIETPGEAAVGAYATLQLLAQHHANHDVAVVAAFGDPGVAAAKELLDIPVIGLTESAVATAFLLGGRFSIVGISQRIGAWYTQTVDQLGLSSRMASYRGLEQRFSSVGTVQHEARDALRAMCLACVEEDGADSIIMAGAPLAGLAREIAGDIPVPLIDGVGSAIRMAMALGSGGYAARRSGALSRPPAKTHQGLESGLVNLIGRLT
jgi:allantoin racemase